MAMQPCKGFITLLDRLCFSHDFSYNTLNTCEGGEESTKFSIFLLKQMHCGWSHSVSHAQKDRNSWSDNVPNYDWVDF